MSPFSQAIETYRADAAAMFTKAHDTIRDTPVPVQQPNETPDELAERRAAEEKVKKARGEMAAAISQLSQADTMESQQQDRAGYADVIAKMVSTWIKADAILARVATLGGTPGASTVDEAAKMIDALTGALQALAQISPKPVWQKAPPPGSGN